MYKALMVNTEVKIPWIQQHTINIKGTNTVTYRMQKKLTLQLNKAGGPKPTITCNN